MTFESRTSPAIRRRDAGTRDKGLLGASSMGRVHLHLKYVETGLSPVNRERLLDEVRQVLAKTGFYLSEKTNTRGLSFDAVARRDEVLLLVKVLLNVDAFSKASAEELK